MCSKIENHLPAESTFPTTIFSIFATLNDGAKALFAATLWSIWRSRNAQLREQKQIDVASTCFLVKDTIHYYNWCIQLSDGLQDTPQPLTWKKPNHGWIKCNFDSALFSAKGTFDICICFRDSLSHFVHAHSRCFPFESSATESEATALLDALQISIDLEMDFDRVIFKSDCQHIVNAILSGCNYVNELGMLLSSCRYPFSHQMLVSI